MDAAGSRRNVVRKRKIRPVVAVELFVARIFAVAAKDRIQDLRSVRVSRQRVGNRDVFKRVVAQVVGVMGHEQVVVGVVHVGERLVEVGVGTQTDQLNARLGTVAKKPGAVVDDLDLAVGVNVVDKRLALLVDKILLADDGELAQRGGKGREPVDHRLPVLIGRFVFGVEKVAAENENVRVQLLDFFEQGVRPLLVLEFAILQIGEIHDGHVVHVFWDFFVFDHLVVDGNLAGLDVNGVIERGANRHHARGQDGHDDEQGFLKFCHMHNFTIKREKGSNYFASR